MKRILGGLLLGALLVAPALAADIPARVPVRSSPAPVAVAPYYNWSGCYIGANGGGGFSGRVTASAPGFADSTRDSFNGALAGGQVGCNMQMGSFVYGVEVDGQWANISRSDTFFGGLTATSKATWFMTARGRMGFAANNWLFYATGGYAHIGYKNEIPGVPYSDSGSRGGWTVGAGVEVGFWNNWSLKGEYLYLRTFDRTYVVTPLLTVTDRAEVHIARVGLNYRFGGGSVVARY